jgi:hypothetical protein
MKELRGMKAIQYAEKEGISFNIDENYLIKAEGELQGRSGTLDDLEEVFQETFGQGYKSANLLPGSEDFEFLLNRYGDAWIYIPIEGLNPKAEEHAALRLFRRPLRIKAPSSWVDLKTLVTRYKPRLRNTGFAPDAELNLLFHAALRLVEQERLESLGDEDPSLKGESGSYGRRRFIIPPSIEIYLGTLLCDRCRDEYDKAYLILHHECAVRLRKALTTVTSSNKAR